MVKKDSVSYKALAVARVLDQLAAVPGRYVVEIDVEPYGRNWTVDFWKNERMGKQWHEGDEDERRK